MAFTYRFVNNDSEIIYVGKTGDLKQRLERHQSKNDRKYQEMKYVEYIETQKAIDAFILETYYINKYLPKYNNNWQKKDGTSLKIDDYQWELYTHPTFEKINLLEELNKHLKEEIIVMEEHYKKSFDYQERYRYEEKLSTQYKEIGLLKTQLREKEKHVDFLLTGAKVSYEFLQKDRERSYKELIGDLEIANVRDVRKILNSISLFLTLMIESGEEKTSWTIEEMKEAIKEEWNIKKSLEI